MTRQPLEYQQVSSGRGMRRFWSFFAGFIAAGAALNAAPYWLSRADYVTIGFPFQFYSRGDYVNRGYVYTNHLLADVLLLLLISSLVAWRLGRQR